MKNSYKVFEWESVPFTRLPGTSVGERGESTSALLPDPTAIRLYKRNSKESMFIHVP